MSVTEPGDETRTAVVEREIKASPEKLWRALTQPHLLEEWLMQNDFTPKVGHRFQLKREPKPDVKVVIDCEVLEVDPNRTLSYAWKAFGTDTVVTFTLTPTPTGTHLRVEQSGFRPDQQTAFKGAHAAWRGFFNNLEALLAHLDDENNGEKR